MRVTGLPTEGIHLAGTRDEAVVLIHGWTGHALHWRPIGEILNEAGYTVAAPLMAGHGSTVDEFDRTTGGNWLESVRRSIATVADHGRIHLVGLSLGGSIAILLAGPTAATSITTINTPVLFRNRRIYSAPILAPFRDRVVLEPAAPPDPELADLWGGYESASVHSVNQLLGLVFRAYRMALRLRRPSLVIQSRSDATVHPRSGRLLARALNGRLEWLDDVSHNAIIDPARFQVADLILEHLGEK